MDRKRNKLAKHFLIHKAMRLSSKIKYGVLVGHVVSVQHNIVKLQNTRVLMK